MPRRLGHILPLRRDEDRLRRLLLPSEIFHENSKITPLDWELGAASQDDAVRRVHHGLYQAALRSIEEAVQFGTKEYPGRPRLPLPTPPDALGADLGATIRVRRTVRPPGGRVPDPGDVGSLLFFSYGVTRYDNPHARTRPRRAVPSPGALYSLELYLVALDIEALPFGVYHYEPFSHVLERLRSDDPSEEVEQALIGEGLRTGLAGLLVVTTQFERLRFKYGELGYRLGLMEAGHVGQNLCLVAAALGLGVCPLASFVEDRINDMLGVDGVDETAVYTFAVGRPARR